MHPRKVHDSTDDTYKSKLLCAPLCTSRYSMRRNRLEQTVSLVLMDILSDVGCAIQEKRFSLSFTFRRSNAHRNKHQYLQRSKARMLLSLVLWCVAVVLLAEIECELVRTFVTLPSRDLAG